MGPIKDHLMRAFGFTPQKMDNALDNQEHLNSDVSHSLEKDRSLYIEEIRQELDELERRAPRDCESCKWTEFGTLFGMGCYVGYHLRREHTKDGAKYARKIQTTSYRVVLITSSVVLFLLAGSRAFDTGPFHPTHTVREQFYEKLDVGQNRLEKDLDSLSSADSKNS